MNGSAKLSLGEPLTVMGSEIPTWLLSRVCGYREDRGVHGGGRGLKPWRLCSEAASVGRAWLLACLDRATSSKSPPQGQCPRVTPKHA